MIPKTLQSIYEWFREIWELVTLIMFNIGTDVLIRLKQKYSKYLVRR